MSAWTSAALADRRRDLAERNVRAGTAWQRAAEYLRAQQQTPTAVRWWSWVRSVLLDGVTPARVRGALADALDDAQDLTSALAYVEDACGWRTPVGLVNDVLIGCAGGDEADAIRAALAAERSARPAADR